MRATTPAAAAAALLVLAACGSSSTSSSAPGTVKVVAAENFWGDITSQIGGSHVSVTSIISDPNADPHSYETDPKDAAAISSATFVVLNGAGYDDFASKLLAAAPSSRRAVITIAAVVGATGDVNPHLWYDPTYVKQAAGAIEAGLAKADPADAATFSANTTAFLTAYQPYLDTLGQIQAKYAGAPIAYTERVPGYLVDAAGLKLATPASFAQSIEDGDDPSVSDVAAIDGAVTTRSVKVLFYNAQVTSPTTQKVQDLAKAAGVPVVGVSETVPRGEKDFQTWQIDQARAVLTALGG